MLKEQVFNDLDEFLSYVRKLSVKQTIMDMGYLTEDDFHGGSKVCCPFHEEKTPSCQITDDFFKCYGGCGAKGDLIKFIELSDSLSFMEAIQKLAEFLNCRINNKNIGEFSKKKAELSAKWNIYKEDMQKLLKSNDKRLIEYVQNQVNSFMPFECGYDKITKYICLAFTSKQGQILGFTKRRVDYPEIRKNQAKWIHSNTENSLISECSNVFNLSMANNYMNKEKQVYLTEGPRDVAALLKCGFYNTIAVCGSHNFNEKVLSVINPVNSLILTMDGDAAGKKGSYDVLEFLAKNHSNIFINSFVVDIPEEMDPEDYRKTYGEEELKKILYDKKKAIDWIFEYKEKDQIIKLINSIDSPILIDLIKVKFIKYYGVNINYVEELILQDKNNSNKKDSKNQDDFKNRLLATAGKGRIEDEPIPGMSEEKAKSILQMRFGIKIN